MGTEDRGEEDNEQYESRELLGVQQDAPLRVLPGSSRPDILQATNHSRVGRQRLTPRGSVGKTGCRTS